MDCTHDETLRREFFQTIHRLRQNKPWHWTGDLTRGEFFVLNQMYEHLQRHPQDKGVYVSALVGWMRVSPPAVSRMLRGLEQRGLVERVVDRADRRTTYVVLTPAGESLRTETTAWLDRYTQRVVRRMGQENMETLLVLWDQLSDIMAEEQAKGNTE